MSHYFFAPIPVHAQAAVEPPAEIRARKFVLVDENGTPQGVFGFRGNGSPDIQVYFGKPKGLAKLTGSTGTGSVRWLGIERKNTISELSSTHP